MGEYLVTIWKFVKKYNVGCEISKRCVTFKK